MSEENRTDEFVDPEEKKAREQLARLNEQAHEGALFSDWSRSFCTRQMFKWLDEQIQDTKNQWLAVTSREEAEAIRLQAKSYTKIKNWAMAKIRAGELASEGVKRLHDEGVKLEGLIRPPTGK